MQNKKRLGIWMDHSSAHLTPLTQDPIKTQVIDSKFTHQEKEESLQKGESLMHHKEQQQQGAYYHQIGDAIKAYDEVILFGPTDASLELFNLLSEDQGFSKIKIEVQKTDKMTEGQQHSFVKAYFQGVKL